jgi:putative transcriptional regulator
VEDRLFDDLVTSAKEMVQIEQGVITPDSKRVHVVTDIDVAAIREATGLKRSEFASALGVDYASIERWENKQGTPPLGAVRKLLLVIQQNPFIASQLVAA